MLTLKNTVISALLILAAGLSSWSIFISGASSAPSSTHASNQPDAYMENIVATIIDKQGNPELKVSAPKMIHYLENDTTHIENPHVTIYRKSPEPWYIDSNYAETTNGLGKILFSDNVVIHHAADKKDPNTIMKTNSLTIFPSAQIATTDQAITITQPDTVIHAVGMFANMEDGTIKLLADAKGEYVPSS